MRQGGESFGGIEHGCVLASSGAIEMIRNGLEDRYEHSLGEPFGLGIITTAVVAIEEHAALRQRMSRAMCESM